MDAWLSSESGCNLCFNPLQGAAVDALAILRLQSSKSFVHCKDPVDIILVLLPHFTYGSCKTQVEQRYVQLRSVVERMGAQQTEKADFAMFWRTAIVILSTERRDLTVVAHGTHSLNP